MKPDLWFPASGEIIPVSDVVLVRHEIISLQGQTVKMVQLSPEIGKVISVAGLPAGTYIVSGTIDGKLFRTKLIKL